MFAKVANVINDQHFDNYIFLDIDPNNMGLSNLARDVVLHSSGIHKRLLTRTKKHIVYSDFYDI